MDLSNHNRWLLYKSFKLEWNIGIYSEFLRLKNVWALWSETLGFRLQQKAWLNKHLWTKQLHTIVAGNSMHQAVFFPIMSPKMTIILNVNFLKCNYFLQLIFLLPIYQLILKGIEIWKLPRLSIKHINPHIKSAWHQLSNK